ncbi:MAG: hypothetical protein ACMXYA_02680 [Candidatus Woesearchaeota archaeon]
MIREENVLLDIPSPKKITRTVSVFYNPLMKENRDLTVEIYKVYVAQKKQPQTTILLPLEGTGVRGIRIQKALPDVCVKYNDISPTAVSYIQKHLKLNKVQDNFEVTQLPADMFLLKQKMSDIIDIDPYGTPNPFLDAAAKRIKHGGLLSVTATDTAALCGSSKNAARRKYGLYSHKHIPWKHELGVRTLIAHVQRIGAQFERALIPVLSYVKDHYYRVFFLAHSQKKKIDRELDLHQYCYFTHCGKWDFSQTGFTDKVVVGPLYTGKLYDADFFVNSDFFTETASFPWKKWLDQYVDEMQMQIVGTYVIPLIAQHEQISQIPSYAKIIDAIHKRGYEASRSVFEKEAIRSTIPYEELYEILVSGL